MFDGTDTPPETVEQYIEAETERASFDVYEENWDVLRAFVALQSQWRVVVGGMARPIFQGIDYASVPAVLANIGIHPDERDEVFAGIRIMEAAAVPERNRRDE